MVFAEIKTARNTFSDVTSLNGFSIAADDMILTEGSGVRLIDEYDVIGSDSSLEHIETYRSEDDALQIRSTLTSYSDVRLTAKTLSITNISDRDITLSRIDTIHGTIPHDAYTLHHFISEWGTEFTAVDGPLQGTKILQGVAGRSTRGMHPWFFLEGTDGRWITGSIAWSGNWIIRFEPVSTSGYRISGGLNDWEFSKTLRPGETIEAPSAVVGDYECASGDLLALEYQRYGSQHLIPTNKLKDSMPVTWNHWWPYQEHSINEDVFKANVDVCASLGFDVCVLDEGWHADSNRVEQSYQARGDWNVVRKDRFPSGLRHLSDYVHAKGMHFALWCEIESLGDQALLQVEHPEYAALRDGKPINYVCMGNPEVVDWAYGILTSLIKDYNVDWIKIDFNLDPGAGCNRTDHGHGAGDGLFEHYKGYYSLLDRVRENYPEVLIENCSSGGLRIDLGILKRTHLTFLSDLDYTSQALEIAWGAATMLPPSACLKFTQSQTSDTNVTQQNEGVTDPVGENLPQYSFDYIMRAAFLDHFACSYRLVDFPEKWRNRLKYNIDTYKNGISEFVKRGEVYRLTAQPGRKGDGDRWNSSAYVIPETGAAVMFVFRLAKSEQERVIRLKGLVPETIYNLSYEDSGAALVRSGEELMGSGLTFTELPEESSEIVRITPVG